MPKQEQEPNRFLERQALVMQAREELRKQREAEAEQKRIQVSEPEAPKEASQPIFNANDAGRPLQPRIIKPAPLDLEQLKQELIEAGNAIDSAQGRFAADNASLDNYYKEQNDIRSQIAELQKQLAEKQARLHELEEAGTPRDRFAASIVALEREVAGLAGGSLLQTLSEAASQKIFGIAFEELSKDSQRDVQARYRKALQKFTSQFYLRFSKTHAKASADQVNERAEQILDDLDNLLTSHLFAGVSN